MSISVLYVNPQCIGVRFTRYKLTSAVDIMAVASHHELLQVGVGSVGGHHGVTPGLSTHAAAHRVTGKLHQLDIIIVHSLLLSHVLLYLPV